MNILTGLNDVICQASNVGCTELELQRRREQLLVERTRREAQLAAQQYEEERIRTKQIQKEAVLDFVRVSTSILKI